MTLYALKQLRIAAGLSNEDLAALLHVSPITYYFYETGRRRPSLRTVYVLAEFYRVPLDCVYGRIAVPHKIPGKRLLYSDKKVPSQSTIMQLIGDHLQTIRHKRDKTQLEASRALGVSRSTYTHYENGQRQISAESLVILANFFDVTIDWLCGRAANPDELKKH